MADNSATKNKGDVFRDKIKSLCLSASYRPISEVYVAGKKADLVYEIHRSPRPARIAIEAKNYGQALQKSMISEIIGDYGRALKDRIVDEVWVVAQNDFSSAAREALESEPGYYALSYGEFIRTLINFPRYLESIVMEIESDGIEKYYVQQAFTNGANAYDELFSWCNGEPREPIAVLSTYGMGKTSLAKMLSLNFAREALRNPLAPIPILIRLGELSSQQEMEGLLGAMFTSRNSIEGYCFPLFQKMNDLGHFILILDGLDEMRHAMSWDDFQYNFKQIKKLVKTKTRAILLGRPNTFASEQEYKSVIEGVINISGIDIVATDAVSFSVRQLEAFDENSSREFLTKYMNWSTSIAGITRDKIETRVDEIASMDLSELISRPVHAQMIASIGTDFSKELKLLSRFGLYNEFINSSLKRDYERTRGMSFKPIVRRRFLQRLAWWLWFEHPSDSFRPNNLDLRWLDARVDGLEIDGIRRELVSGALLETKLADYFYFAHRSFQEYLIAEQILNGSVAKEYRGPYGRLTGEIIEFIRDVDDVNSLSSLFDRISDGKLHREHLMIGEEIIANLLSSQRFSDAEANTPLGWFAMGTRIHRLFWDSDREKVFAHWSLAASLKSSTNNPDFFRLLTVLWVEICNQVLDVDEHKAVFRFIVQFLIKSLPYAQLLTQVSHATGSAMTFNAAKDPELLLFSRSCKLSRDQSKDIVLTFDTNTFQDIITQTAPFEELMPDAIRLWHPETITFALSELGAQSDASLKSLRQLYARTNGNLKFVRSEIGGGKVKGLPRSYTIR